MKTLKCIMAVTVLSALLLGASCLNVYINAIDLKPPPDSILARTATTAQATSTDSDKKQTVLPPTNILTQLDRPWTAPLLAIAGLLSIWLFYRSYLGTRRRKAIGTCYGKDLALLDFATDTLGDLRRSLESKTKVIPFPKK